MRPKIYLAGRMSGLKLEEALEWRNRFIHEYCKHCESIPDIFNPPMYYNYSMDEDSYTDMEAFRFDLRRLKHSDLVIVNLDGAQESVGTCQELMAAYLNDIPVLAFHESANREDVLEHTHPWLLEEIDRIFTGDMAIKQMASYVYSYYGSTLL